MITLMANFETFQEVKEIIDGLVTERLSHTHADYRQ